MQRAPRNNQTRDIKRNQKENTKQKKQTCKAHKSKKSSSNAQKCKGKLPKGECDDF
jgi:hypothetical protein